MEIGKARPIDRFQRIKDILQANNHIDTFSESDDQSSYNVFE